MSAVSGTTRDAIDTEVTTADGKRFMLIDTAGIRKRAAVADSLDGAEPLSVGRALQAIRRSQVPIASIVLCLFIAAHQQMDRPLVMVPVLIPPTFR